MSELSPALSAVSFDQMRAVSALGERLVYDQSTDGVCGGCALLNRDCAYGKTLTFCGMRDRNDRGYGVWRLAP